VTTLKVGDLVRITADLEHGIRGSASLSNYVLVRKGSFGRVIIVRPASEIYRLRILRFDKDKQDWRPSPITIFVAFAGAGNHGQNQWEPIDVLDLIAAIPDKPRRAKK
jgi:hypothetical protein